MNQLSKVTLFLSLNSPIASKLDNSSFEISLISKNTKNPGLKYIISNNSSASIEIAQQNLDTDFNTQYVRFISDPIHSSMILDSQNFDYENTRDYRGVNGVYPPKRY